MAYIFLSSHQRPILSDCSIISDTKWSSLVKAGLVVSFPLCLEIIFGLTIWDYVSALVTNSHSPNSFSIHQWSLPEAVINEGFLIESFLLHLLIDVFCSERTYPVSSLSSFLPFISVCEGWKNPSDYFYSANVFEHLVDTWTQALIFSCLDY